MGKIHSMIIQSGGLAVHYYSGGCGESLVIIHGGGDDASSWKKNVEELAKAYTVYLPDLPGFGNSEAMEDEYSMPNLVEFVECFTQTLGMKTFYLMGHSYGGGIAVNYALDYPEKVKKLVLVSSMCLGNDIAWWLRLLSIPSLYRIVTKSTMAVFKGIKLAADFVFSPAEFKIPFSIASIYLGGSIAGVIEQSSLVIERLSEIVVPTLLIWGAKDPVLPAKLAYAAAELIPDCQVKVFADCGHSVYRDRIPEFSKTLTGFLG